MDLAKPNLVEIKETAKMYAEIAGNIEKGITVFVSKGTFSPANGKTVQGVFVNFITEKGQLGKKKFFSNQFARAMSAQKNLDYFTRKVKEIVGPA